MPIDWNALPDWKLTWKDSSILLRISKVRRAVKSQKVHSSKLVDFLVHKQGNALVGYQLKLKSDEYVKYDRGWFICLFFTKPEQVIAEPIYFDENIRLIKTGKNYTFAIRWKQRQGT